MNIKSILLNKILVFVILILFIGMGSVSSNSVKKIDELDSIGFPESINSFKDKGTFETTVYWFSASGLGVFRARGPGNITWSKEWEGDSFFSGGTWTNDGRLLCCLYENGTLYDIDPKTFDAKAIGNGGVSLNSLAYDPVSEKLYGAAGFDLYEINIETGEQIHIGEYGDGTPGHMIGISFDLDGVLYGWDLMSDSLWTIDTNTGEASLVGPLGININYAQDGSFDYSTDILYLAAYTNTGQLYECDEDTGECTLLGNFEGGNEITVFVVSYELYPQPPKTKIEFDPLEPDGTNGWFVSNVTVTLNATDNSGIIYTFYRINGGEWEIYESPFTIPKDGEYFIEYYSYDYIGNFENIKSSTILIDQTTPDISLTYEILGGNPWNGWDFLWTLTASDDVSGMQRAEFYLDGELQDTIYGPGPEYSWLYHFSGLSNQTYKVRGLIFNPQITEENISFFAILVKISSIPFDEWISVRGCGYDNAGNVACDEILNTNKSLTIEPGIYLLQRLILPNNYEGYMGKFLIFATFKN